MSIYKFISHDNPKISSILKKILSLHPQEINLSLDRIRFLLKKLKNPQKILPYAIHIAGTNGKGSVATSIYQLQKLSGKKVHVYRSPHLTSFNERIVIANKIISDESLYDALNYVYKINDKRTITFFEFFTAMAFYIFSKNEADVLIVEVGLGGTFDATNVLNHKKKTCIITTVGLDHKEYLGNTIKDIATEKSGIIKSNNFVICSQQNKKALSTIQKFTKINNCRTYFYGKDWYIRNRKLFIEHIEVDLTKLSLKGNHQYQNIGCAILACYKVKYLKIDNSKIPDLVSKIKWEGRLHRLEGSFKKKYPDIDFWVDCAHNPLGFKVLSDWILKNKINKIFIILALGIKKDKKKILKQIKKINPRLLFLIKKTNFTNIPAIDLYKEAKQLNLCCKIFDTVKESINFIDKLKDKKVKKKTCLISGSINLVGDTLREDKEL